MNVAPFQLASLRTGLEGDFDYAVDNYGNPFGFVADWFAFARWGRFDPLAARRSGRGFGYQSRYRPTRGLERGKVFPAQAQTRKEPFNEFYQRKGFLCAFAPWCCGRNHSTEVRSLLAGPW